MKTKKLTISNKNKSQSFAVSDNESVAKLIDEIFKDLFNSWKGTENEHLLSKMYCNMTCDLREKKPRIPFVPYHKDKTYEVFIDGEPVFKITEEYLD